MSAKRQKVIRRVYEEGRETTVKPVKKHSVQKKKNLLSPVPKKLPPVNPVKKVKPSSKVKIKIFDNRSIEKVLSKRKLVYKNTRIDRLKLPEVTGKRIKPAEVFTRKESAIGEIAVPGVVERVTPTPPKMTLSPEEQRNLFIDSHELPKSYDHTYISLLIKDPYCIFAHWETSERSVSGVRAKYGEQAFSSARKIIRMNDVTLIDYNGENANSYFDIDVGPFSTSWYINLWCDNISYIGEIGYVFQDGRFESLAKSNIVYLPRMGYSPRTEQIWMKVTDRLFTPPFVFLDETSKAGSDGRSHTEGSVGYHQDNTGGTGAFESRHEETGTRREIRHSIDEKDIVLRYEKSFDTAKKDKQVTGRRRIYYLTDEDIRQYYAKLTPLLRDVLAARLAKMKAARPGYELGIAGDSALYRMWLFGFLPAGSFIRRMIRTGSSEVMMLLGGSEQLVSSFASGGSENISAVKIKQRTFFFELNTELIVYGRTEPDADVWMGSTKVPLRPDGTFSMRFALPDGRIPLEFTAESRDKEEKRVINTYVARNTHYGNP